MAPLLPGKVLIVDDDPDTRANLCDLFELDEQPVETASSIAEVLSRQDWPDFSAVLLDRRLPDGNADELLPRLRQLAPEVAVLIVTGYSDLGGAIGALRQGAADYILKPIDPRALRASLLRVADRQRLALAKARSEAAFAALVEAAPCLVVILRPNQKVLYLNRLAEDLTGQTASALLGQEFTRVFLTEESRPRMNTALQGVLAGSSFRATESPLSRPDGSRCWVLWNARRLADYEGAEAVLVMGQDVTELKLARERTLQAERLAAIGQMVAGLAHESGNALARTQTCLEMLALEMQDRAEALELIDKIQRAQNHLQQLHDEVRNYATPLRLERESVRLESIWRQAWANLAGQRAGRRAHLSEATGAVDTTGKFDPFRLEQVFRNLFENSLSACRDPVEVTLHCQESLLEGRPALLVSVRDNGPGLSQEQRQRIFEPFFTTRTKGTGLGMAIAQRIVEAHGGRIAVGPEKACRPTQGGTPTGQAGAELQITLPRQGS